MYYTGSDHDDEVQVQPHDEAAIMFHDRQTCQQQKRMTIKEYDECAQPISINSSSLPYGITEVKAGRIKKPLLKQIFGNGRTN